MGKLLDRFVLKVLEAGKYAAQQQRCIDRRSFRVPYSFARVDICKVKKKASMSRQLVPQKVQRRSHPRARVVIGNESPHRSDADCRQAKADRRDTCNNRGVFGADVAAIFRSEEHTSELQSP